MRKKEPLLPVLILGLLAFTVLWPLWFTVDGALMALDELTAALGPALLDTADGGYAVWTILPSWPTLQPLAELLLDTPQFFSVFWNTCLLAFAQIAGQLVVAAPASWAFAKLRFAGRRFLLLGYIALMVLPFQVLMVPNYLIATRLGIYDTPLSVILPGVFSAFPVFIMTRSFQDVPNELLEAAKLDGATAWQIFWKIGVPLGYAGIFAALVLNFIEGWNAVEQPLLFLKSQSNWPLSMYMNDIVTDNLGMGEDQLSRYAIYMATLGNRPDLFPDSPYVNKYIIGKPGDYEVPGEYLDDETFAAMLAEAQKYIGYPYVWGGSSPATSFDCSGYVSWVINHSGWNVGRLGAQGLYNICTPTSSPKPGDLVFFKGTYDTPGVSHCGIYVGDGKMLHCGDPIGYANLNTSYWQSHFYAYGRLP